MKKKLTYTMVIVLSMSLLTLILSNMAIAQGRSQNFRFVSGTVGGTWYAGMGAVAEVLAKSVPGTTTHVEPGGSYSNIIAVDAGEADFGFTGPGACDEAWKGEKYFKDKGSKKNFRTICTTIPFIFQTVALEKSGIKTYADLKGKKYVPALKGQTSYEMAKIIVQASGLKMEDMKIFYFGMREAIDAMKDGNVDAYSTFTSFPQPMYLDINSSQPVRMIGLSKEKQEEVLKLYPGFSPYTMKGGAYPFMKEDTLTVLQSTILIVRKDVATDIVYKLTKSLFENKKYLETVHANFDYMTPENSIMDIKDQAVPLHEGATKYYHEIGIKIPDKLIN